MNADTCGHLLPDLENDTAKMEAGTLALVGKIGLLPRLATPKEQAEYSLKA